jgi:hypothetical protein
MRFPVGCGALLCGMFAKNDEVTWCAERPKQPPAYLHGNAKCSATWKGAHAHDCIVAKIAPQVAIGLGENPFGGTMSAEGTI